MSAASKYPADAAPYAELIEAQSCQLRHVTGLLDRACDVIRLQRSALRGAGINVRLPAGWCACSTEAA